MQRARSPTKAKSKEAALSLESRALEYSKVIFDRFCWFFLGQLVVTYIMIALGYGAEAQSLMDKTIPLYQTVAIAYYGKAGVENVSKIVTAATRINSITSDDDNG